MLSDWVRRSAATRSGTEPYSTEEVPLSAMPMSGSSINAAGSGNGNSAMMPAAVRASVSQTVAIAPMRPPMKAQASLPAAPPANTNVIARPTCCRLAPFSVSTNGRNNKKPMRVALSRMPMPSSIANAEEGCGPPPLACSCFAAASPA
jgi:hypothetical protein